MDACEYLDTMNDMLNANDDEKTSALIKVKEVQKLEHELENLKLRVC